MNREIEFRGVCIDTKEWVYGYYVKGSKRHCIQKSLAYYPIFNIIPETLGQYTGLKDCNGVKIFEGDIIDIHQTVNGYNQFVIEYDDYKFSARYYNQKRKEIGSWYGYSLDELFEINEYEKTIEVIGNIYEKELQKD